jgi:cyclophilin family peptidyl-prolyl cis-trans isomerase
MKGKTWPTLPDLPVDLIKPYQAAIEADRGRLNRALLGKDMPRTVNNFVFLARQSRYDGITFDRVILGFMAQGGDPTRPGRSGPGGRFGGEFTTPTLETGALSLSPVVPGKA